MSKHTNSAVRNYLDKPSDNSKTALSFTCSSHLCVQDNSDKFKDTSEAKTYSFYKILINTEPIRNDTVGNSSDD